MVKDRTQKANQPEWPADKVERRPLATLIPYARNSRTHSEHQVAQIAASMREWGWTNPVLIDEEGTIIAGHARVQAAYLLGLEEVPCMVARGWTETQRRAYVIADNRLALNAGWDYEVLNLEMESLRGEDFNLDLLGFEAGELSNLGNDGWATDIDEVEKHEETLSGIAAKIVVKVESTYKEEIIEVIKAYCDSHVISVEVS